MFYIGVDGGGTKTVYTLFDENKNILDEVKTPGSNHENMEGSFDEASEIIWGGLTSLVAKHGISLDDVSFTLMGLAGIDHPYQHDIMCEKLNAKGLKNYAIYNDGFLGVKAGSETGAAIGYNMGTGMCCNAIDRKGEMRQLAGLGEFSGDIGGGHQIAITAYRIIYDDVMLNIAKTAMTDMFFEEFGVKRLLEADDYIVKGLSNQMLSEFVDGSSAEFSNLAADYLIMAKNSNYAEKIQFYLAEHPSWSYERATEQALIDEMLQIAGTGVEGVLSDFVSSSIANSSKKS